MDGKRKELLRFTLQEEIAQIESYVSSLGAPVNSTERSLIARYGKLLLLSEHLLKVLTKSVEHDARDESLRDPAHLTKPRTGRLPDAYLSNSQGGFSPSQPGHC